MLVSVLIQLMMAVQSVCTLNTAEVGICFIIYSYFLQSLNLSDIWCYGPKLAPSSPHTHIPFHEDPS
jgi:hypothetical protein